MKLKIYVQSVEPAAHIARRIGVAPTLISQWIKGVRPVPELRCVQLERATLGQVMRWDLRPGDWWQIWPELIANPDAPSVPQAHFVHCSGVGPLCPPQLQSPDLSSVQVRHE